MPVKNEISRPEFDKLLKWLDADPETAGREYERIRTRLIKVLHTRGCLAADELADETIDRVIRKVDSIAGSYKGEPTLYFLAVARNVFLEHTRKPKFEELPRGLVKNDPEPDETESHYKCLSECLAKLPAGQRQLVLGYYEGVKQAKIDRRKQLVELLGTTNQALRVRVLRLRLTLQKCVLSCVDNNLYETF
jgi:DNA-directed RNA polymerase specialized sigma24 family protein